MAHALRERYSSQIDALLRKRMVFEQLCNTYHEGDPTSGSVKIPVRDGEVTVNDYNSVTGAPITQGTTTYTTLVMDQYKAVNEKIDNYVAAAVPDPILAQRINSAAYSLGLTLDSYLIGIAVAEGTTDASTTALTTSTIYDFIVDKAIELDEADVPMDGRWIVLSPSAYGLLIKSDDNNSNFIKNADASINIMGSGYVGMIDGFNVFKSNNMPANVEFICGHEQNFNFVMEWMSDVKVNDLTNEYIDESAVQGKKVYGATITKSETVIVKTFS